MDQLVQRVEGGGAVLHAHLGDVGSLRLEQRDLQRGAFVVVVHTHVRMGLDQRAHNVAEPERTCNVQRRVAQER